MDQNLLTSVIEGTATAEQTTLVVEQLQQELLLLRSQSPELYDNLLENVTGILAAFRTE
jgi:hypothetical protein